MTYAPVTIVISRTIPSLNATMWRHRQAYVKERDFWLALLRVQLRPRLHRPDHAVRCRVVSLRVRLLDYGNLVGGAKPIPDGLKRLGYIHDDSPAWFTCAYEQQRVPQALACTRIHLEAA